MSAFQEEKNFALREAREIVKGLDGTQSFYILG